MKFITHNLGNKESNNLLYYHTVNKMNNQDSYNNSKISKKNNFNPKSININLVINKFLKKRINPKTPNLNHTNISINIYNFQLIERSMTQQRIIQLNISIQL